MALGLDTHEEVKMTTKYTFDQYKQIFNNAIKK